MLGGGAIFNTVPNVFPWRICMSMLKVIYSVTAKHEVAHTFTCMYTWDTHIHTHARTHAHTHTHPRTHIHTHTHTQSCYFSQSVTSLFWNQHHGNERQHFLGTEGNQVRIKQSGLWFFFAGTTAHARKKGQQAVEESHQTQHGPQQGQLVLWP